MTAQGAPEAPPRLGLAGSLIAYGAGAGLLFLAARWGVPALATALAVEPVVAWFLAAGLGVFAPLVLGAALALRSEHLAHGALAARLWLRPLDGGDWAWLAGGALFIMAGTAPIVWLLLHAFGAGALTPDFLSFEPLTAERMWVLAAWAPFFALNMLGEAFVWHSVMLPRQAQAFGAHAWIVSALGWALFHIALPWTILVFLIPTLAAIPFIVQRRRNVWIGVVLHVLVNGPGFLAVAFGLM